MLTDVINHVREDIGKVTEPKFQALLETSAEILGGPRTAYEHYEKKTEPAFAKRKAYIASPLLTRHAGKKKNNQILKN